MNINKIITSLTKLGEFLVHVVYPNRCACCSQVIYHNQQLCDACQARLPMIPDGICPSCEQPYKKCRCYQRTRFAYTTPLFYKETVKDGILTLKKGDTTHGLDFFADLMAEAVTRRFGSHFDGIVYVPITAKKLQKRGYNQSQLLAKALGKRLNLPVLDNALVKLYDTNDQHKSSVFLRKGNIFGVFEANEALVKDKHLLLVDDVITTGVTMDECGKMLLIRGCEEVCGIAIASAVNKVRQRPKRRYRKIKLIETHHDIN